MIPGVETFHPRESWVDPAYPVTGPPDNPRNNTHVVIHYTAADDLIDGDPGEHAEDLPAYMRAMNKSYWTNRDPGYSLGYLFAVDWLGGVWQIRGWDIQSAANRGWNDRTFPVLMLVDGDDEATEEAAASVRAIVAEATRRAGRPQKIVGHGEIGSTSCPGAGLQPQIAAGVFEPKATTPEPSEVNMIALDHNPGTPEWTALLWSGVELSHVFNGHADAVLRRQNVPRQTITDAELDAIIASSTTKTAVPKIWAGTERGAAWAAQRA